MTKTIYVCDVCAAQRGEANHWFRASELALQSFRVATWDAEPVEGEAHLCGPACVHKWVEKKLTEVR